MGKWVPSVSTGLGGRFQILFTRIGIVDPYNPATGIARDVSFFRGVATQLQSFSQSDPFGDGACAIQFPQITPFDDFDDPDIGSWLADFSQVDIWWVPGEAYSAGLHIPVDSPDAVRWFDLNQLKVVAPVVEYVLSGLVYVPGARRGVKVFEGYVTNFDFEDSDQDATLSVQCQGALYQGDRYLMKPFYPANPQTLESLIAAGFDHAQRPQLRTQPMQIKWPSGWTQVAPAFNPQTSNVYAPNVAPGTKWTGYTSRATGAWDRTLTGFIQDNVAVMITQDGSGVEPGNQWTLMQAREGDPDFPGGRTPVLQVRDRFRDVDFELWYGQRGVKCSLSRDMTQIADLVYGDGTDVAGTVWRNAVVSADGSRTDYTPLAASQDVYPQVNNPFLNPARFASEAYVKYGTGFNQPDAVISAQQTLQRDLDPGWAGTLTLQVDPSDDLSRWQIQAGWTMRLKGFVGTGVTGMRFHVASVECDVISGSVTLTVDTRYRDLLNLTQALARARDPLTPSKLLQLNRASAVIQDVQAPWDYSAGSGYVPLAGQAFYNYLPSGDIFPYNDWCKKHPPFTYPSWYVKVDADSANSQSRWGGPVPILMAEKGTIAHSEFFMCDRLGNIVKEPFSVSLYYVNVTVTAMPQSGGVYSPFIFGAFETINPSTGQPWSPGLLLAPDQSFIIGWGNYLQPAGFSPGLSTAGGQPTGLLEDDATWTFDCTNNPNYNKELPSGQKQSKSAITIYAMFYAEYSEPVYFQGRLFLQPQGAS